MNRQQRRQLRSLVGGCFRNYVVLDFEYESKAGWLPNVLCLVAYLLDTNLQLISKVRLWRGEFGDAPPFDIGPDTLVIGYSLWAEMTCFQTLGWKLPVHTYDLHTAFLSVSNILLPYEPDVTRKKQRKRLSDACRAYGIEGWENIDKPGIAEAIGEGRWREYGQPAVFDYCEEDVRCSMKLFRAQLAGYRNYAPIDPQLVMRWSEYSAKSVARVQARGIPIDMYHWDLVQEHQVAIVRALIEQMDPSQGHGNEDPIYTLDGHFSEYRFGQWLGKVGIPFWPKLDSGALQLDGDAFRLMQNVRPMPGYENSPWWRDSAIEDLHALRDSLGVIVRARIPIGPDGRNRPSLFPFGTATGRNAQSKSLYNAHSSMRSFMMGSVSKIVLYLDWRTQEVGVAASRSGDERLTNDYLAGDIYHALAKMCGLTNLDAETWKSTPEGKAQRQQMKTLQLGINYGMGIRSLARGLDRHLMIASEVISRHQQRYETYWTWRESMVDQAMNDRVIASEFDGWPLHLSSSPNHRSLFNFPMQSGGAEMLRLATNWLCEADLVPIMLVHDGILFELDTEEQVEHAKEIMRKAGAKVCDGLMIGVDEDQKLIGGARYRDKRGIKMWNIIMEELRKLGAISEVG